MHTFATTKRNAELFQKMLQPILVDPTIESWQLAIALDWAKDKDIEFVWFRENAYGLTYNGLTLIDRTGEVLLTDITGYADSDDKLLQEAINAHIAMHTEKLPWGEEDD